MFPVVLRQPRGWTIPIDFVRLPREAMAVAKTSEPRRSRQWDWPGTSYVSRAAGFGDLSAFGRFVPMQPPPVKVSCGPLELPRQLLMMVIGQAQLLRDPRYCSAKPRRGEIFSAAPSKGTMRAAAIDRDRSGFRGKCDPGCAASWIAPGPLVQLPHGS
jgi:hypothetical protein